MKLKQWQYHISCDFKCKFNSTTCNLNQRWNNEICQCKWENVSAKEDYGWNPSTCICENSMYLKSIAITSVTECESITVIDNVSTRKSNT